MRTLSLYEAHVIPDRTSNRNRLLQKVFIHVPALSKGKPLRRLVKKSETRRTITYERSGSQI